MCQGKKVANDREEVTSSEEKSSRARSSMNDEHTMEEADKDFTETANVSAKNQGADKLEMHTFPAFVSANGRGC